MALALDVYTNIGKNKETTLKNNLALKRKEKIVVKDQG